MGAVVPCARAGGGRPAAAASPRVCGDTAAAVRGLRAVVRLCCCCCAHPVRLHCRCMHAPPLLFSCPLPSTMNLVHIAGPSITTSSTRPLAPQLPSTSAASSPLPPRRGERTPRPCTEPIDSPPCRCAPAPAKCKRHNTPNEPTDRSNQSNQPLVANHTTASPSSSSCSSSTIFSPAPPPPQPPLMPGLVHVPVLNGLSLAVAVVPLALFRTRAVPSAHGSLSRRLLCRCLCHFPTRSLPMGLQVPPGAGPAGRAVVHRRCHHVPAVLGSVGGADVLAVPMRPILARIDWLVQITHFPQTSEVEQGHQ